MKRSRAESTAATQAAYQRLRAEADAVRARAAGAKTAEEIAAEFEAKVAGGAYDEDAAAADLEATAVGGAHGAPGVQTMAAMPGIGDPKLWMLMCKEGEETAIMIALVNKFVATLERDHERLPIMSAVCSGKGCVRACGGRAGAA